MQTTSSREPVNFETQMSQAARSPDLCAAVCSALAPIRVSVLVLVALSTLTASGCGRSAEVANPSGTFEAPEIDLAPLLTARVLEVRADEGDRVAAGDTLVVLDTELLKAQREQVAARQAVLAAQSREVAQLETQGRRRLDLAETTLRRTESLNEQGSASKQQLDELRAERDIAKSQLQATRERAAGIVAQGAEVERSLAVFDRQIDDGVVIAPQSGTVLLRTIEPGEVARAGALALRVADLSSLELRVFLEETDLDLVRVGGELPVLVDALEGEPLGGVVSWISDEAEFTPKNAQTRKARAQLVYAVKLTVQNPNGTLHIGMPAAVRIG
ncbi:MAG: efflux RND transporter periplasmic adaptor subunit [Candidatus Eisenbacteria bacterium]